MRLLHRGAGAFLFALCFPVSSEAIDLALRYPSAQDVTLHTVTWSGSLFIAAGEGGVILTSADGVAWEPQEAPLIRTWRCSASGGGRIVLGGDPVHMLESTDGVHWNAVALPTQYPGSWRYKNLEHAVFDSGRFFLTGGTRDSWVYSSGTAATVIPTASSVLNGMASGPSGVVCLGDYVLLHFTGDGWNQGVAIASTAGSRLVWTGSGYIAIGNNTISTSPDGVTWTRRESGVSVPLNEVIWTGSKAVIVGKSGTILTSPDGVGWTVRNSGTTLDLKDVAWSGTTLVAVGASGIVLTSPDGVEWTKRKEATEPYVWPDAFTWLPGGGYAGDGISSLRSQDGITWTRSTASGPWSRVLQMASNGTRVVLATEYGLWQGLPDGSSWTPVGSSPTAVVWDGRRFIARLVYQQSEFFADCYGQATAASADGVTWSGLSPPCPFGSLHMSSHPFDILFWTGQRYIRQEHATDGPVLLSSTDFLTWQLTTGATGTTVFLLSAGNAVLAIGSGGGTFRSSTGGVEWEVRTPRADVSVVSPVWTGSQLMALGSVAGESGILDGTSGTWTRIADFAAHFSSSMAWTGARVVLVRDGSIFTVENRPQPVTWQSWLSLNFPGVTDAGILGAEADPDGDGWGNLLEYAAGSAPNLATSRPVLRIEPGSGGRVLEWESETGHSGVQLVAEISDDLLAWDYVTGTVYSTAGTVVTRRFPIPPARKYFVRLKATFMY
jgi:hypothetical protein